MTNWGWRRGWDSVLSTTKIFYWPHILGTLWDERICKKLTTILYSYVYSRYPLWGNISDSSRGLKSVCKFRICKKFAKILHRRKNFLAHFAKFLQLFCNFFAIFLQFFFNFFTIFLQIFCNFFANFCTFISRKELEVMNLSFNSLF